MNTKQGKGTDIASGQKLRTTSTHSFASLETSVGDFLRAAPCSSLLCAERDIDYPHLAVTTNLEPTHKVPSEPETKSKRNRKLKAKVHNKTHCVSYWSHECPYDLAWFLRTLFLMKERDVRRGMLNEWCCDTR